MMALIFSSLCLLVSRADMVIDMTYIGNVGNLADSQTGRGAVNYNYYIGTYEVTVAQYTDFLNAVASFDPYNLYNTYMADPIGYGGACIFRSGNDGSYIYTSGSGKEDQPIRYVDFFDSVRFCNWLHNGQGNGGTETGSYNLSLGAWMTRGDDATWILPVQNEWYKAAYYDPVNECYYDYPNGSDETPVAPTDETTPRDMNFGNDPLWHGESVTFTSIGETIGNSPYGVCDMGGNVEEWTESFPPAGAERMVQGGGVLTVQTI